MTLIVAQAVDPASGTSARADFFAIATAGLDLDKRKFYILDLYKARHDTTEQPYIVAREYDKWRNTPGTQFYAVGVETIFYQTDLFRHLKSDGIVPLYEIARRSGTGSASLSKYFRILGLAGRIERGDIVLPGHFNGSVWAADYGTHPWLSDLEDEMLAVNWVDGKEQHAHDDAVDAVSMVVDMLSRFLMSSALAAHPQYTTFSMS